MFVWRLVLAAFDVSKVICVAVDDHVVTSKRLVGRYFEQVLDIAYTGKESLSSWLSVQDANIDH